jgi:predicted NUDIX family NTP pyrophosphohydrolase
MKTKASTKQSAGLLLYRRRSNRIEVLLGHPGGPFWRNKDPGSWSIPKGLIAARETPLTAAKREFAEETGHSPDGKTLTLGEAKQPGGKVVHVWAIEGDWDAAGLRSNTFEAKTKILKGQAPFIDRLLEILGQVEER